MHYLFCGLGLYAICRAPQEYFRFLLHKPCHCARKILSLHLSPTLRQMGRRMCGVAHVHDAAISSTLHPWSSSHLFPTINLEFLKVHSTLLEPSQFCAVQLRMTAACAHSVLLLLVFKGKVCQTSKETTGQPS